jgi:hypothetical protein
MLIKDWAIELSADFLATRERKRGELSPENKPTVTNNEVFASPTVIFDRVWLNTWG